MRVERADDPKAGQLDERWAKTRVSAQHIVDRGRIAVQVEERATSLHERAEISDIPHLRSTREMVSAGEQLHHAVLVRQPHRSAVDAVRYDLNARHAPVTEKVQRPLDRVRRSEGDAHRDAAVHRRLLRTRAQLAGCRAEHLAGHVVELPNAREA